MISHRLLGSLLLVIPTLAACGDNRRPDQPGDDPPDAPLPPPDGGETVLPPIGRAHAGGVPSAVTIVDGRAFFAIGPRLEIRDAATDALIGETAPLRGQINALAVVGDRAFVAERADLDSLVHVFDISNPAAPVETKVLDLAQNGFSVIHDLEPGNANQLFVADQEQGVIELDITNPDEPATVRVSAQLGVQNLELSGRRLYFWSQGFLGDASIGALDTLQDLKFLGQGNLPGVKGVDVTGNFAVGAGPGGIFVFALGNPAAPAQRFAFSNPEGGPFARAVVASGTTAYIPAIEGLFTLDLRQPAQITMTGPLDAPTLGANAVDVEGNLLAVLTDRGRLVKFDVTTPLAPTKLDVVDITLCADCVDIATAGDKVFLADILGGVRPAGLGDLAGLGRSPEVAPVTTPDGLTQVFEGLTVVGERAYVADWYFGLRIFDVTDLGAMQLVGSLVTGGAPSDVAVEGNRAYVAEGTGGGALRVIDITDPANPAPLAAIATSKGMDLKVQGGLAYLADESLFEPGGLRIYNVANPPNLQLLATYDQDCQSARDVALHGKLAIVACESGFHVVDVTVASAPARRAVIPVPGIANAWSVAAYDGHAVLGYDNGVTVVSLADPTAPVEVTTMKTAGSVRALAAPARGRIVAAVGGGGVYQWQLD